MSNFSLPARDTLATHPLKKDPKCPPQRVFLNFIAKYSTCKKSE